MDDRQEKELVGMIMRKEEPLLRKLREVERFLDDHRDGATFISNLLAGLVSRLFGMDQEGPSWLSAVVRHDARCSTPASRSQSIFRHTRDWDC